MSFALTTISNTASRLGIQLKGRFGKELGPAAPAQQASPDNVTTDDTIRARTSERPSIEQILQKIYEQPDIWDVHRFDPDDDPQLPIYSPQATARASVHNVHRTRLNLEAPYFSQYPIRNFSRALELLLNPDPDSHGALGWDNIRPFSRIAESISYFINRLDRFLPAEGSVQNAAAQLFEKANASGELARKAMDIVTTFYGMQIPVDGQVRPVFRMRPQTNIQFQTDIREGMYEEAELLAQDRICQNTEPDGVRLAGSLLQTFMDNYRQVTGGTGYIMNPYILMALYKTVIYSLADERPDILNMAFKTLEYFAGKYFHLDLNIEAGEDLEKPQLARRGGER